MAPLIARLSDKQAIAEARIIAERYCHSTPVSSRIFAHQGCFSKTACVTLENGSEVIVQFKDNEIDTTKVALARSLIGEIVPFTFAAETSKVNFAYVSDIIKGTMWSTCDLTVEQQCHVASQLGSLLPQFLIDSKSAGMVTFFIIPRLKRILLKENIVNAALKEKIEALLSKCEHLKMLPLALCHIDLNSRNILLDENQDIVGIVDWEQADLLPIGTNAWCIRFLSVAIIRGEDKPSEKSLPMAEAFWKAFIAALPESIRPHQGAITVAMQVGLLLNEFFGGGFVDVDRQSQILDRVEWLEKVIVPLNMHE